MPSYFFPMIVDSVIVDSKYHNIENKKERKREKNVGGWENEAESRILTRRINVTQLLRKYIFIFIKVWSVYLVLPSPSRYELETAAEREWSLA